MQPTANRPNFLTEVLAFLTRSNLATFTVLTLVVVGLAVVLTGGLTLDELVKLLQQPVAGLVVGGGLASISFTRALPGEKVLGFGVLIIVAYLLVGAIQVLTTDLTFPAYLKLIDTPTMALAIGKGAWANNATPAELTQGVAASPLRS